MLFPAPSLKLLPLTIVVPELSPWLAAFNLLAIAAALRFHRRLAPILAGTTLILAWPLSEIPGIARRMSAQLSEGASFGAAELFRGTDSGEIQPETLPLNILYYRPRADGPRPGLIDIYGRRLAARLARRQPAVR